MPLVVGGRYRAELVLNKRKWPTGQQGVAVSSSQCLRVAALSSGSRQCALSFFFFAFLCEFSFNGYMRLVMPGKLRSGRTNV